MRRGFWFGWLSVLLLELAACNVSPRPEPPPVEQPPYVDVDRVMLVPCGGSCDTDGISIEASAGAVSDPDAQGWIVNLDRLDPPIVFDVKQDGGFSIGVAASAGEEIRLQFRREGLRSDPIDFVVSSDSQSSIERSKRVLSPCLLLEPATQLGVMEPGSPLVSIRIENGCNEPVEVTQVALRLPDTPYSLRSSAGPFTIAASGMDLVEVELTEATTDDAILFIEVDAPAYDRRPITLYPVEGP
jgi:hypothetical protein